MCPDLLQTYTQAGGHNILFKYSPHVTNAGSGFPWCTYKAEAQPAGYEGPRLQFYKEHVPLRVKPVLWTDKSPSGHSSTQRWFIFCLSCFSRNLTHTFELFPFPHNERKKWRWNPERLTFRNWKGQKQKSALGYLLLFCFFNMTQAVDSCHFPCGPLPLSSVSLAGNFSF